jgi:hypothetical protein
MVLAKAFMAIGAATQGLLITFMAVPCCLHDFAMMHRELFSVIHEEPLSIRNEKLFPVLQASML